MLYRFFIIATLLMCPILGCIDLEPDPTAGFKELMTAQIDQKTFSASEISMTFSTGNLLTVTGLSTDSSRIIIELSNVNKIGVFEFNNARDNESIYIDPNGNDFTSKKTLLGSIEITSLNQVTVEGTFNFIGENDILGTLNVSDGVFAAARD